MIDLFLDEARLAAVAASPQYRPGLRIRKLSPGSYFLAMSTCTARMSPRFSGGMKDTGSSIPIPEALANRRRGLPGAALRPRMRRQ